MTLALHGKSRTRQGLLGLLAVLAIAIAVMAAMSVRETQASSHEVPPSNSLQMYQWKNSPDGWITGSLNAGKHTYKEGDSVPFHLDLVSLTVN